MILFNSLSKKLEEFKSIEKDLVKMYVCGITPYDTTHLGHAFTYLSFDALIRYLKYKGNKVIYTQNVTDINDRDNDILKRAEEQNTTWQNLSKFWTDKFLNDMQNLNWIKPDNFLFASEQVSSMIQIIEKLLKNGCAYEVNNGIYLNIDKKKDFGKLSGFDEKKMLTVAKDFDEDLDNQDKRNKLDITLWRPTNSVQGKHIPSFESPFGPGRPGWHLECSAMAIGSLGEQIDIHGGGEDLIYPHHESEIAQSEGASGKVPFAKFWLHTGTVGYKGKKMSKSLGNLVLVSDLLKKYSANSLRYLLLSHHYRDPWEFKETYLAEAEKKVSKIKQTIESYHIRNNELKINSLPAGKAGSAIVQFSDYLDDNLNTPLALDVLCKAENTAEVKLMSDILGFTF